MLLWLHVEPGDSNNIAILSFMGRCNCTNNRTAVKFADVKYGTHNIDAKVEKLITKKTKAIIPVSYHGLPCDADELNELGKKYNIPIIEDNAQTHLGEYKGSFVGTKLICQCFHLKEQNISLVMKVV